VTHSDPTTASLNLQDHLYKIEKWLRKWKMKVNETKSSHIMFTLRKGQCPPVCISQTVILLVETIKYLGLHFYRRFTWNEYIVMKRKQLDHKTREIKWLIGKTPPYHYKTKYSFIKRYSNLYGPIELNCGVAPTNPISQLCRGTNLNFSQP